ncbi:drug/metabolite transporter (DMT)-like permease [Angulomicrobium tetraedrale]|uniref:Drug/metabolite transporter (DMT)-like permease n=1 Tax=Ancylobacter tetraedralis TaxID=217068 RepID=A0A839Z369_9HYPH|nr:DMT family transporter [Ancylobacter tetraedralis]MBB3770069.1 drug/metabolite transporter (DMT)-like permease [Ancylobacter tetraedralis]
MNPSSALRRGILLMIAGSSIFATNDAFSKLALAHIPPTQVLAIRGAMAGLFLLALLAHKGKLASLRFALDSRVLLRSTAEAFVAVLFITAITTMSIGDAAAIIQIAPLITMAAAVLLFGTRIELREWVAVLVGFAGVVLIVKPGSSAFDAMALLPIGSAVLLTFRDFVTQRIGAHVPILVVTFATAMVGMLLGFGGSLMQDWRPLDLMTLAWLLGGSLTLICGHMLTIAAFRGNDAAVISPFRYAAVVCSVALSAAVFNEMPDLVSIGGMALITAAGLYAMHRHRPSPAPVASALPEAPAKPV